MKSLKQLFVLGCFAALACTGMHAQDTRMRAPIPFNFVTVQVL
jgi:hypothetical protein